MKYALKPVSASKFSQRAAGFRSDSAIFAKTQLQSNIPRQKNPVISLPNNNLKDVVPKLLTVAPDKSDATGYLVSLELGALHSNCVGRL